MRNILYTLAIVLMSSVAMAQTTTENYVKSTTYQVKTLNGTTLPNSSTPLTDDDKIVSITYFDGLGRPIQSIAKQAGGNHQDIISPIVYDVYGRQSIEYLPYVNASQVIGTANLNYRNHAQLLIDLEDYYVNKYPEDVITSSTINAYSEKAFESSPLNRVLKQAAPGKDWEIGNGHTIKLEYQSNVVSDDVIRYKVIFPTQNTEDPQLFYDDYYSLGELYKTITKDENWTTGKDHTTEEFKDSQGRVILKRTYTNEIAHDTYYVYDDYGNLTYVLSPKGSDLVLSKNKYKDFTDNISPQSFVPTDKYGPITGSSGTAAVIVDASANKLVFNINIHLDDPINLENGPIFQLSITMPNMIIGTFGGYTVSIQDGYLFIAGSGNVTVVNESFILTLPVYSVATQEIDDLCYQYHYDKRNRLIEKKIPQKGWEYIVYDNLDRPILTQDAKLGASNHWLMTKYDDFDRVTYTGKHYNSDNRADLQNTLNNQTLLNESPSTTASSIDGADVYYTNTVFPTNNIIEWQTINYYDTYTPDITSVFSNPSTVYGVDTANTNTKALPTGSRVRALGSGGWTTTATYYDEKARPLYIGSDNMFLGTKDIIETNLDFIGKPTEVKSTHIKAGITTIITDNFTYDHTGRLLTQKQQIGTSAQELIVSNTYDELGQLKNKGVGNIEASPLQTLDYTYNIRGWLKTINDVETLGNDLFSFKLNYNTTEIGSTNTTALYNGNISETIWKTANDVNANNETRGYAYAYDDLNRFTRADYGIKTTGSFDLSSAQYNVYNLNYDKNGNILSLRRVGELLEIDKLTYSYNGNQLSMVDDASLSDEGFNDGNTLGDDYTYDVNGNMVEDKNKDITEIGYNYLNLPEFIEFNNSTNKTISYFYDATGIKLMKVVNNLGIITTTKYAGNFIYEDTGSGDVLKFFSHPEGYVEPDGQGAYSYVYQYKDHLGNIRLAYNKDVANSVIIQEDYTNSTYDWSAGGSTTINNNNSEFNISIVNKWNSTNKYVSFTPNEPIHIEFDFENVDMVNPRFYVREQINGVWEPYSERDLIVLNSDGHFTLDLNPVGDYIRIYFVKGTASDDGTLTSFKIDNLVITQNIIEIIEENNYYPFGLKHKGYNDVVSANVNSVAKKFKYNGIEYEESLGLDLYEMDVRSYDPAIGRFTSIDPVTHHSQSTYVAFDNNPVFWADPSGADSETDIFGRDRFDRFGLYIPGYERTGGNGLAVNIGIIGKLDGDDSNQKKQTPTKPQKIDLSKDKETVLYNIVEWAIYIRKNNKEKIFLNEMILNKNSKSRNVNDALKELAGGSVNPRKTIRDGKGNSLYISFDKSSLEPTAFTDNSITRIDFLRIGDSNRYDIRFLAYFPNQGQSVSIFSLNFYGKDFYDQIKKRILEPTITNKKIDNNDVPFIPFEIEN